MASNREQVLVAVRARLRAILQAEGFRTNVGQAVFLNEVPDLGPDDPDEIIAMVVGTDQPRYQGMQVFIDLPIEIQAVAKADLDDPYLTVEAVLADVKEAIELEDRTLNGLVKHQIERGPTRTLPREPGSTTVGVAIMYGFPYTEVYGAP